MPSLPERLRALLARGRPMVRRNAELLIPLVLIVFGVTLGLASLTPAESLAYADSFTGTLAPGNTTLLLPGGAATYVQVNMSVGACGLRLYPATELEWIQFNTTGHLPATWIGCTNRTTTASDVADLILVNDGASALPYEVIVQAYLIESPYAWISLPATALALAGLLLFVPRFVLREAVRWRDEWDFKKEKK